MKLLIGEVSKIFGITTDTLRYYDKIGILTSKTNPTNNYRYYLLQDLEKLGLILGIKDLGVSLSDIKETIENESLDSYKNLLDLQKLFVSQKIKELIALEKTLTESSRIVDNVINFQNKYDFTKIKISKQTFAMYGLNIKSFLNSNFYDSNDTSLKLDTNKIHEQEYI